MNTTALARRAVRLFPRTEMTSKEGVKHLRRGWVRSVLTLGDKWILHAPVQKKSVVE